MKKRVMSEFIREIKDTRTKVYEKDGIKIYALRKINGGSLKEDIEIRVVKDGTVSSLFEIRLIGEKDSEKIYKELLGCAGLDFRDIKILGNNINKMYEDIKIAETEEMSLADLLETVYELLEDRVSETKTIKNEDINLERSIIIQGDYYLLKAATLRRIADEVEIKYTQLRKELVSLGFIETGRQRDSVSVSLNNRKMKLLKLNRKKFISLFDLDEDAISV